MAGAGVTVDLGSERERIGDPSTLRCWFDLGWRLGLPTPCPWVASPIGSSPQRTVRHFLAEVGDQPWQETSVPLDDLSERPTYEVRVVALEVRGEPTVRIYYRHVYAEDVVDVIAITNC